MRRILTSLAHFAYAPAFTTYRKPPTGRYVMKIKNSLKTLKSRHKACRIVKRKGRVYIINKENPRFKARQR